MTALCLNMLSYLKPFHCPSCENHFSNKDSARLHAIPRFPLILTCGHTVCESCIRNQAKSSQAAVCTICKTVTNLSNVEQSISQLPPDLHVLGILSANLKQSLPSLKLKMVPTSIPKQVQNKEIATVICEDCCHTQAVWRCDKCEQNFCESCFDHIHSRVKSMRKHQGRKICAEKYNTMVQEGCKEHKRTIEFFCEDDNSLACSYCVGVGNHKGHSVMTLSDKNESCAAILENVLQEVQILQKRFRYTEHKINETIPLEKVDISGLIKQVHDHFHMLHALLQLREADLVSYLEEISNTNTSSLEKMRAEISVYEKDLNCVMRDAAAVIKNPSLSVCATDIIKKLEECKTLPCYFTPISDKSDWTIGIELDLDSTLEEILSKHGRITADIKPKYCLKTSSEMPEDSVDIMDENLSIAGDTESVISNLDTFSEDSLSTPLLNPEHFNKKSTSPLTKPDFVALQQERVIISHIKNPACFYAQKCSEARKMKNLSDAINKYCKHKGSIPEWSEIEKGEVYLVQYSGDSRWYRGRVLELYEQETKRISDSVILMNSGKNDMIKNKDQRVKIFYIDYGNSEIVPKIKLRNIQTQFLHMPGLARQCCLWDILPSACDSKKITWSEEATKTFAKFVGKRPVIMQIMEERNNILYVDLSQSASDDISNDVPVSVRDALVFLEFGCFPSGNAPIRQKNLRQFMPPEQLLVNININAIISHVNNPSLFYVQQMSTARYLSELIFEMQHTYNNDQNTLLNGIYVPFVGMICAAQFRVDKQWYRAQVLNLPGGSMVEVRYVDFGNTEVIHYKSLRKLFDKFCKLNIQAIPCTLADVVCKEGSQWPKETTQWLAKKGSKKQLKLKAFGIDPGNKFAKVALYDVEDNFEICLNTLMVEEGLAASSGTLSKVGKTPIEESVKIPSPIPVAPVASIPHIPKPEPPPAEEKKVEIIKRKTDATKQLKVRVSYIENPGLFYIRPDDTEEELTSLMKDLQMDYTNFEGDIKQVSEGQACAAYSDDKKKWYRATVLHMISEDKVQVRYADYGFMEELPIKNLRNLHEKYYKIQSFIVRCHLSNIIPAGGSNQWSHMSCDAFQQLVSPYEILYLVSKGTADENKSLPSDLLIEELIRGGALEPTEFVTLSITTQLIEKGVALPIRKNKKLPKDSNTSTAGPGSGDNATTDSGNNTTNSTQGIPELIEKPKPPQKPNFQWKPSVPPKQQKFFGAITNIGDDGCVHLHFVEKGSSIVGMIKNALQCKYENCPYEFLRLPPAIGEACMAKFVDKLWYRAEVLATYIDKVKVLFVDYGNCEMVTLTDIRTDIIMSDYPRQCLECRLPKIKPARGEQWGTRILDFLHETLVDQTWEVELLGAPDENNVLPAKISSGGIDVSNLLLDMQVAVPIEIESESLNLTLSSNLKDSELEAAVFQNASKLPEKGHFPVCVTQLFEPNIVCIQWIETPEPRFSYEEDRNEELREFLHLTKDLRERADSFSKVDSPKPGMACCAKYGLDDNWYRCEVTDIVGDEAKVLYVDYGNSETIPFDRLRKLSSEFLKFPVQVHVCKLHGLKPPSDVWDPEIMVSMDKAIFSSGKDTFAQVVKPGKISEVHLYLKNDEGEYDMAYNQLIEDGLILIENSSS